MRWIKLLIFLIFNGFCVTSYASETVYYVLRSNAPGQIATMQNTLASLVQHSQAIDILISQAYQIDQNGIVWGYVDPEILRFSQQHALKLMVLVTNANFDKEKTHKFLTNPTAVARAIQTLLTASKKNHYYGVQFDFEMLPLTEKAALTNFYQTAAKALHKAGFAVSFAVAPVVADPPQASEFLKRSYTNWEGVYDLPALAESGDFLSIMAYNQHSDGTTPGPTASFPWVQQVVQYALQYVPPQKISLGVAAYSSYWFTGTKSNSSSRKITTHLADVSYAQVLYLLQKYHANLVWDAIAKVNYASYEHNWLNEYLFVEDAQSLRPKLDLVKKYHLRGISVFTLGIEDPKTWDEFKK